MRYWGNGSAVAIALLGSWILGGHARADGIDDAVAGLRAPEVQTVRTSIEQLGASGDPRAIRPLADRITEGLPPALLDAAVTAVIRLGTPASHRVLYELCRHRRPTVRVQALSGLVRTRAPRTSALIIGLLDDPSAAVRSAAVNSLDTLDPGAAWQELLAAARRGQPEAAAVLGRRANAATIRRILAQLTADDVTPLADALGAWIARTDLPPPSRTAVVDRALPFGAAAHTIVHRAVAPLAESDPIRRHAEEALGAQREVSQ